MSHRNWSALLVDVAQRVLIAMSSTAAATILYFPGWKIILYSVVAGIFTFITSIIGAQTGDPSSATIQINNKKGDN